MANDEHLAILRQGVDVWNAWREEHPTIAPDLREAGLRRANFSGADLAEVSLYRAGLYRANLAGANLQWASLYSANLAEANLTGANLIQTNLQWASLYSADLSEANLTGADLSEANLTGADLQGASLIQANLVRANLAGVNMREAQIGYTVFVDVDLRGVQGLDTVWHNGPSSIGIDTLYRSQGDIPEAFLRGCGVPDSMIEYAHALVAAERPIDYYSCFISYSSTDESIAKRLHADLQAAGVRCWFAPHDLEIGVPIVRGIDEAIRLYDKVLIILSEASVKSHWVAFEVDQALHREVEQGRTMLFPIRLDDTVLHTPSGWAAQIRTRNIGDFQGWKDHDRYQEAFNRLLRDLKAKEEAGE